MTSPAKRRHNRVARNRKAMQAAAKLARIEDERRNERLNAMSEKHRKLWVEASQETAELAAALSANKAFSLLAERLRAERDDAREQRRKWQEASVADRAEIERLRATLVECAAPFISQCGSEEFFGQAVRRMQRAHDTLYGTNGAAALERHPVKET